MKHLPDKVNIKHGRYYYVVVEDGKRKWLKLTRVSEGESAFYIALGKIQRRSAETLSDVFDLYIAKGMNDLAPGTQKGYLGYIRRSLRPAFGDMLPDDVEQGDVAEFLEIRKDMGAAVTGNRERACLMAVFNFAMRRRLATRNPCHGVARNPEKPKDRYVEHDEYLAYFDAADDYVQDLMAVIYLIGLRPDEARKLKKSQLTPKGIRWKEGKTGKVKIVEWSSALQFFVTRASSRFPDSPYVLNNSLGGRWTEWAMHSVLRRIRKRVDVERWTWHDLRAKAESDSEEGLGLLPLYKRHTRIKPVR